MITAQVEDFVPFLNEIKPMFPAHYQELALDKEHVPLDPQYDVYLDRARRGEVMSITIREDGKLIGYFVGFVAPGLHYKTCLTLTMDILYVMPEHRGSGAGNIMFDEVERECKRRGVQRMFVGTKLHKDISWLYRKRNYKPVEEYYSATFF